LSTPEIRPFTDTDWPAVWAIVHEVVTAEDTFPFDPAMPESLARAIWIEQPPGLTVVAVDGDEILGSAKMGANRPGPGAHVSTASFMVAKSARGRGVGTALCRHAVAWARNQGFASMQFNAVVDTNTTAVSLYQREGFQVIGTVPRSFQHPVHGRVGLHVMYLEFDTIA
jgi:L-amino acid N-acyltransferase YncA